MALEREFLKLRYQIICKRMSQDNEYDVDEHGNFYLSYQPKFGLPAGTRTMVD
jgi:hypothetical protein